MRPLILSLCLISVFVKAQTEKKATLNLHEYLGLNFNDSGVVDFCKAWGDPTIKVPLKNSTDYIFWKGGVQFRVDSLSNIEVIFIYVKNNNHINQKVTYKGPLPFGLSMEDDLETLEAKLGKGTVINYNGRYDRIYKWIVQDSIQVAAYILLPRQETEKSRVDYLTFSKKGNRD